MGQFEFGGSAQPTTRKVIRGDRIIIIIMKLSVVFGLVSVLVVVKGQAIVGYYGQDFGRRDDTYEEQKLGYPTR